LELEFPVPENQDNETQKEIKQLAEQLRRVQPEIAAECTLYNFAFGVLYAFGRAVSLEYLTQYGEELSHSPSIPVSKQRATEVSQLAANLASENVPLGNALPASGKWLAGYYYNDALLRVDVCYEQVTRYFLNEQGFVNGDWLLAQSLKKDFPPELVAPTWPKVRGHVNDIKHKSTKKNKTEGPAISPADTLNAIKVLMAAVAWVIENRRTSQRPEP
jgi:hypothetical protein